MIAVVTGQVYENRDFIGIYRVSAADPIRANLAEEHTGIEVRFYDEPQEPQPVIGVFVKLTQAGIDDIVADFAGVRWLGDFGEVARVSREIFPSDDDYAKAGIYLYDSISLRCLGVIRSP
jgi:hypothetical protein